mmetsp:Transcript_23071/g.64502  ORF Transcript_23071/g.64502 Transcript_23071/m.64502 type:complete len:201 (+) Transcript_23071:104-706(+)
MGTGASVNGNGSTSAHPSRRSPRVRFDRDTEREPRAAGGVYSIVPPAGPPPTSRRRSGSIGARPPSGVSAHLRSAATSGGPKAHSRLRAALSFLTARDHHRDEQDVAEARQCCEETARSHSASKKPAPAQSHAKTIDKKENVRDGSLHATASVDALDVSVASGALYTSEAASVVSDLSSFARDAARAGWHGIGEIAGALL